MSTSIEKELKTEISLNNYLFFKKFFKVTQKNLINQENYYFDTPDAQLKKLGIGLRIRFDDNKCEFTMKINHKEHEKIEITDTMSIIEGKKHIKYFTFPIKSVAKKLNELHIDTHNLIQIGHLKNKRYEIVNEYGTFALDKSYFSYGITYELEFEYSEHPDYFFIFLSEHNIPYKPLPSKLSRSLR